MGLLRPLTGIIDAHKLVISHSDLPTPPARDRSASAYSPAAPPTASTPPRMMRPDLRRQSVNFPQSGSASPIAQYSPYSQPASIASSHCYSQSGQEHYPSGSGLLHLYNASHGSIPIETERNSMIPMAPSQESSIQLITIKSQHGHPVQIPIDVQAASKMADEKRQRNAGASARFRARRKEKEREASMSISRLEQQVRDALEDAEYYRSERDYFKAIVYNRPSPERHYARPPSPRLRRLSVAPSQAPSSTTGAGLDGPLLDYENGAQEE